MQQPFEFRTDCMVGVIVLLKMDICPSLKSFGVFSFSPEYDATTTFQGGDGMSRVFCNASFLPT